jgi:exopolyphosphatase/guanosine-5'-triphosphate,3'-diphosphate pyrophosphatase
MATAHIHMKGHPLRLLDHYQVPGKKAAEFAALISRQSIASLEKMAGVSKKRVKDMGVAALTMEILFEKIRPKQLIFSGTGLREGLLFDQLTPAVQRQDALIASSAKVALKISRFDDLKAFKILSAWIAPLFSNQNEEFSRLLEASCLLSDASWFEHEDYQAEHAFQRLLVMPFYGIDHAGRAFLALSQYVRYKGRHEFDHVTKPAQKLLDDQMIDQAVVAGLAQHIGYLLTGGALSLLRQTELKMTPKQLILELKDKSGMLNADVVREALEELAKKLAREPVIRD